MLQSLTLLIRLRFVYTKLAIPITEYNYSKSSDGNDICNRLISIKKQFTWKAIGSHSNSKATNDKV